MDWRLPKLSRLQDSDRFDTPERFQVEISPPWSRVEIDLPPGIDTIYANDIDAGAVESIRQNVELNNVNNLVQASQDDAMNLLYSHRKLDDQFHVVDLDPYGTPAHFLGNHRSSLKDLSEGRWTYAVFPIQMEPCNVSRRTAFSVSQVTNDSLLCVEQSRRVVLATDMASLCGNNSHR